MKYALINAAAVIKNPVLVEERKGFYEVFADEVLKNDGPVLYINSKKRLMGIDYRTSLKYNGNPHPVRFAKDYLTDDEYKEFEFDSDEEALCYFMLRYA